MVRFPPGLVWLASYPKSGNTWLRVLLANLTAKGDQPADINNLTEPGTLGGRWRIADDLLVDPDLLDEPELERMRPMLCDFVAGNLTTPFFCKTHDRFRGSSGQPIVGTRARGVLYMLRDPRDVAVSLSHHASRSLDVTIERMGDPDACSSGEQQAPYRLGDWAGHVASWTDQTLIPTKVVRYEDLRADTEATLKDIIAFLGGQATEGDIRRAVDHSSLGELQRQEARNGFRESQSGQARFFRSGRVGEWRDALTSTQVQAIEDRCAAVMARWGYEPRNGNAIAAPAGPT